MPAAAAELGGVVERWGPESRFEVWLTTSLDLAQPGQPVATARVEAQNGRFRLTLPDAEQPYWVFLHQRFQPEGEPPIDFVLPYDLEPMIGAPKDALHLVAVKPAVLINRSRLATSGPTLWGWIALSLLVLSLGLGTRRILHGFARPPGKRSAPLAEGEGLGDRPAVPRWEWATLLGLVGLACALRLPGLTTESLDLLEISYLPGIGRPTPFAEGFSGLEAWMAMFGEVAALYCLDLVHPPLWHFVLGATKLLFGAEAFMRLPALLASLALVVVLWATARPLARPAGLLAASLAAVTAPSIYFGQDATPYAAVGLVAAASPLLLVRALRCGRSRDWHLFFGILVVGFLCHYSVALLGIGLVVLLFGIAYQRRADDRWPAALRRAMGAALFWAIPALLWTWLHLSTFPAVAQDTRLVADTYPWDPGLLSFARDFFAVTAGLPADASLGSVLAALALFGLGLAACLRHGSVLALATATLAFVYIASIFFFYANVTEHLAGRVFYGFRWVGWFHPVLLGLLAVGLMQPLGRLQIPAGILGLLWLSGVVPTALEQVREPSRPDYRAAAVHIATELNDGDALATLPAWFQRGNLFWYLMESGARRIEEPGGQTWSLGGRRINPEFIQPQLPFQSTAAALGYRRLWVAVVDEKMFGRAKFSPAIAEQALAWAKEQLEPDGEWSFDRLRLYRFRRPLTDPVGGRRKGGPHGHP